MSAAWPELAVTQLDGLSEAAAAGDLGRAATLAQLLRNVLVRTPAFREDLAVVSVSAEQIAAPLMRFLRMPSPPATAARAPDESLAYVREPIDPSQEGTAAAALAMVHGGEDAPPVIVATDGEAVRRVAAADEADAGMEFIFPGDASGTPPAAEALLPLDWNGDYRMDLALVGARGFSLLARSEDGGFQQMTPMPADGIDMGSLVGYGAWAADIEMDGDLDIVHGPVDEGAVGAAQQRRRYVRGGAAVPGGGRPARLRLGRSRRRRGSGRGPALTRRAACIRWRTCRQGGSVHGPRGRRRGRSWAWPSAT